MTPAAVAAAAGVGGMALALALRIRVSRSALRIGVAVERVVDQDLADAFIFLDGRRILQATALASLFAVVLALWLDVGLPGCIALAAVLVLLPRLGLAVMRQRRQRRLLAQLPDAIQALAALLRAGHSLAQAAATLADAQPPPLRDEWRLLLRRLRMGERAESAFDALAARLDAPEARLFATTVRIAMELGGSLAEALDNLAGATRKRLEMQARIGALTSQGRLQGLIVGALPLLLMLALTAMDRDAMQLLWTRPAGWAALVLLLCLETCGFVMIRRIVRIDV